jgi:hypothetical protein
VFGEDGIPFRMMIQQFDYQYVYDKLKEEVYKTSVYFVKNTDDNCLYAALFLAYAKRNGDFTIDGQKYSFDKNSFQRAL